MNVRTLAALPALLLAAGCVESQRGMLVAPGQPMSHTSLRPLLGPRVPPHEAVAERVAAVGHKLIDKNPQAGLGLPLFITVGIPQPQIMHHGGGTRGYQVVVSQGLADQCKTDEQLAGVLSLELAKIVAERESGPRTSPETNPTPAEAIGTDAGGRFGPADGARQMELARLAPPPRQAPAPEPTELARNYLEKAGYDGAALGEAAMLLSKAEGGHDLERLVRPVEPIPPASGGARLGAPRPTGPEDGSGPIATSQRQPPGNDAPRR